MEVKGKYIYSNNLVKTVSYKWEQTPTETWGYSDIIMQSPRVKVQVESRTRVLLVGFCKKRQQSHIQEKEFHTWLFNLDWDCYVA